VYASAFLISLILTIVFYSYALSAQVTLTWEPNSEPDLAGYQVYYGTSSGIYTDSIDVGNTNAYTVSGLEEGLIYYFAVTAYNYSGDESSFSNEVNTYHSDPDLFFTPVNPCRIVDTRNSGGIINAGTQRDFYVYGSGNRIRAQGGDPAGCPSPLGEPLAAHINIAAVDPTEKGNLQAFPKGTGSGSGLIVNFNAIDTNLSNAGTIGTNSGTGPDITVASQNASSHTVIDVLGYYYSAP
jgi:hypothetical protein